MEPTGPYTRDELDELRRQADLAEFWGFQGTAKAMRLIIKTMRAANKSKGKCKVVDAA